jgi:uncharacterized protein DUF397
MGDVRRAKPGWRRAAGCAESACVEVMHDGDGRVLLRSSLRPATVLNFTADEWSVFLSAVTRGDFD